MATIKAAPKKNLSGLKRDRQSEKRRLRNQSVQSKVRTSTKKLEAALRSGNKEELKKILKETTKVIAGASSKGVIHRNAASRKISKITKKANAATAAPEGGPARG